MPDAQADRFESPGHSMGFHTRNKRTPDPLRPMGLSHFEPVNLRGFREQLLGLRIPGAVPSNETPSENFLLRRSDEESMLVSRLFIQVLLECLADSRLYITIQQLEILCAGLSNVHSPEKMTDRAVRFIARLGVYMLCTPFRLARPLFLDDPVTQINALIADTDIVGAGNQR